MSVLAAARNPLGAMIEARVSRTLRLFASVYFAVSLFALWGVLTLIGVVVDQGKDPSFYEAAYPAPLARLVLRLHCTNIYHSPAYVGVIALILCSLAVCTFKRVIPARLGPLRAIKIEHAPLHATIVVEGEERDVRARVDEFFRDAGWQVRNRTLGGVEWTFADRHNWARRGVLVAHVGFVIIAIGTTLYWARGYSGTFAIPTGGTTVVARSGATLSLRRFAATFQTVPTRSRGTIYQPIDYVSQLRVRGRDGVSHAATLRVNRPLAIDDVSYYQASYGWTVRLRPTRDGKPLPVPAAPLMPGASVPLDPQGVRVATYERFVGTTTADGTGIDANPQPTRPAVVLSFSDGGAPAGEALVPIGKTTVLGDGYAIEAFAPSPFTGIEYRYDPGIPFVGIGAFVLLAGLVISFGLLPARVFARIDGAATSWTVGLAATTTKGHDIFEERFTELVAAFASPTATSD